MRALPYATLALLAMATPALAAEANVVVGVDFAGEVQDEPQLRGLLAKRVSMKFMPELRFKVDTSFEASARIDELLARPEVARDLGDED